MQLPPALWIADEGDINMAHHVMVGEGVYPQAVIRNIHSDHLEDDLCIDGDIIDFDVPEPILYDLDPKRLDNLKTLYGAEPIPVMHISLLEGAQSRRRGQSSNLRCGDTGPDQRH